jgi:hypothetical protein
MRVLGTWLERLNNLRLCEGDGDGGGGGAGGILDSGGGGDGGSPPDWRESIPEDIRAEPSLASIKTVGDLAKGYVHAQKLVGTDKIAKPNDKWTPEQWSEFYGNVGRPGTPAEYKFGELKLAEGVTLDEKRMEAARAEFHKLGLTNAQAEGMMQYYTGLVNTEHEGAVQAKVQEKQTALTELQKQHGQKLTEVVDVAVAVLQKFGGDKMIEQVKAAGFDNNVELINMLYKVGQLIQEDTARGKGDGLVIPDVTAAKQRIDELAQDKDFQRRLQHRSLIDKQTQEVVVTREQHQEALDEWNRLHAIAYKEG